MKGMNQDTGKALDNMAHLKQSVRDILTTPVGSRVMRRAYGSDLFELIDNPSAPETVANIIAASAQALQKWEPRISVKKIYVNTATPGAIELSIEGVYKPNGQAITLEGIEIQ